MKIIIGIISILTINMKIIVLILVRSKVSQNFVQNITTLYQSRLYLDFLSILSSQDGGQCFRPFRGLMGICK